MPPFAASQPHLQDRVTLDPPQLKFLAAEAVVGSHTEVSRHTLARYSPDPFLRVAAWESLTASGDIFDEDLGSDITDRPKETFRFKTLEESLSDFGYGNVKWVVHNHYCVVGVRGGKLVAIKLTSTKNSAYLQEESQAAKEGHGYVVTQNKEFPLSKNSDKEISEYFGSWLISNNRWRVITDGKVTEKNINRSGGGGLTLKDALIASGAIAGPEKKIPIVELEYTKDTNVQLLSDMYKKDPRKKIIWDQNSAMAYMVEISINGKTWQLDPDTLKRVRYNLEYIVPSRLWVEEQFTISVNKMKTMKPGEFLSDLLDKLTREPSSLIIALSRVVEWYEDNQKKQAGAAGEVLLWAWKKLARATILLGNG